MKIKFNNLSFIYFFIVKVVFIGLLAGSIYYFWDKGVLNFGQITSVLEANFKIEKLKNKKDLAQIKNDVENDRSREAYKKITDFEKEIKNVISLSSSKEELKKLNEDIIETKNVVSSLLEFPELSSIIVVLSNKINSFESFVSKNGWRTLTRIARRMKAKVGPRKVKALGFYNYSKLSRIVKILHNDVKTMLNVTDSSLLTRREKNLIKTKVKTLSTEILMLKKYLKKFKEFRGDIGNLETSYQKWLDKVSPEIYMKKLDFEHSSNELLLILSVIIGGGVFFLLIGPTLNRAQINRNQKLFENYFEKIINEGILPEDGSKIEVKSSQKFHDELKKLRDYIHKRMGFGAIFQEALPFPALMLDKELNLIWANRIFFDDWGLNEFRDKANTITWDYLQRFTNLGENDPVISALEKDIAGIYQIQVKTGVNQEVFPYEMYVSPITYAKEKRMMIFFYPLKSLEETLANQTKSLVGPIMRTLDSLTNNNFNEEFQENIRKDFEIAGIEHLLAKFSDYHQFNEAQRRDLYNEIDRLENSLFDQIKLIDDLNSIVNEKEMIYKETLSKFQDLKTKIINALDTRTDLEGLYSNTSSLVKVLNREESELISQSEMAIHLLNEHQQSFGRIDGVRNDLKNLKREIEDSKRKLVQSIDQTLLFQRTTEPNSKLEQSLLKIKLELKSFEREILEFSKAVTALDVALSKVELVMDGKSIPEFGDIKKRLLDLREGFEGDLFNLNKISRDGQRKDEDLINALKYLYSSFSLSSRKLGTIKEYVSSGTPVLKEQGNLRPTPGIEERPLSH